jgi:predicted acyltransferase
VNATETPDLLGSKRLVSLDAFRGLTIAGMIVVNSPGSWSYVYAPLRHAEWHGLTPTDLVFPFFIFIVGVSVVLAYTKRMRAGVSPHSMVAKIVRRTVTIFVLGLMLSAVHGGISPLRVPGVLQRIALVFLACALLFLYTGWKTQVRVAAVLLVGYWLAMTLIPVPGIGAGILEPGMTLAGWIDRAIVPGGLYQESWDPEGLLSTLPAIASGITGMLAGHVVVSSRSQESKLVWLFSGGFLALVAGGMWGWFFPINKALWTSSYVLYTSGLAAMTFATSIWFVDILGYKKWTHVGVVFGANAITVYVLHGLLYIPLNANLGGAEAHLSVNSVFMEGLMSAGLAPPLVSFMWAVGYTALCYAPIWVLFKKNILIKV